MHSHVVPIKANMATTLTRPDNDPARDDALMRRVAARDGVAFRELVDRYAGRAHRVAWRMLGNGTEAEDVSQEALLRLWHAAPRWRGGGPGVAAWLTRVSTNLCFDRLRQRARNGGSLEDAGVADRADEAPLADVVLQTADQREQVMRAISLLTERQRAAIVLTYYEELPNASAAELLEMNIKAFESLLLRARAAMKAMLAGGDDD